MCGRSLSCRCSSIINRDPSEGVWSNRNKLGYIYACQIQERMWHGLDLWCCLCSSIRFVFLLVCYVSCWRCRTNWLTSITWSVNLSVSFLSDINFTTGGRNQIGKCHKPDLLHKSHLWHFFTEWYGTVQYHFFGILPLGYFAQYLNGGARLPAESWLVDR